MKKIYILLFAVSGLLFSCSTDGEDNSKDPIRTKTNMSDFDQIVQIENIYDQITAASALSAEAKAILWQDKIQNYIANNVVAAPQLNYLNELKSHFSNKNVFIDGHPERINFMENESDFYIQQAKELFGEGEGWYLLHRVENINHRIAALVGPGPNHPWSDPPLPQSLNHCSCYTAGNCYIITILTPNTWRFVEGKCRSSYCLPPSWGWSPFLYNGRCFKS